MLGAAPYKLVLMKLQKALASHKQYSLMYKRFLGPMFIMWTDSDLKCSSRMKSAFYRTNSPGKYCYKMQVGYISGCF